LFLTFAGSLSAQVGIGTEQPNLRAVLDLRSPNHNQGFLAPRLNTAQRTASAFTNALSAAENGLLVFDTDDRLFYYWLFPEWKAIEAGASASVWRSGIGAPSNTLGEENDFYLDSARDEAILRNVSNLDEVTVVQAPSLTGNFRSIGQFAATGPLSNGTVTAIVRCRRHTSRLPLPPMMVA
jgi:hypothetical protein